MRLLLIVLTCLAFAARAEVRVALVIGISEYSAVTPLANPRNDAEDIGAALRQADFEVEEMFDLTEQEIRGALRSFRRRAAAADVAVLYYAGHGIEVDRTNFLIPSDARLERAGDVEFETVPLDLAIGAAGAARRLSVVIVDACRNNPFASRMVGTGTRQIGRGLVAVEPRSDTLVAYAAREGTLAADGIGRNSPFAAALKTYLPQPGLELDRLFRLVRDDVLAATSGQQEPFVYGSRSSEDFFFVPAAPEPEPEQTVQSDPVVELGPRLQAPEDAAIDLELWRAAQLIDTIPAYLAYLKQRPDGRFATLALMRIETMRTGPAIAQREAPEPDPEPEVVIVRPEPEPEPEPEVVVTPRRDLDGDLMTAVRRGASVSDIVGLLGDGASPDARIGGTPILVEAALSDISLGAFNRLVVAADRPEQTDSFGRSALDALADERHQQWMLRSGILLRRLEDLGRDRAALLTPGRDGRSAVVRLAAASVPDAQTGLYIDTIMPFLADLANETDRTGANAWTAAVESGNVAFVQAMLNDRRAAPVLRPSLQQRAREREHWAILGLLGYDIVPPAGLRVGASREVVRALQRTLQAEGHYRGAIDGLGGPATDRAFIAWIREIEPELRAIAEAMDNVTTYEASGRGDQTMGLTVATNGWCTWKVLEWLTGTTGNYSRQFVGCVEGAPEWNSNGVGLVTYRETGETPQLFGPGGWDGVRDLR